LLTIVSIVLVSKCPASYGLSALLNWTKKSLIVLTRFWLDSAKFEVNFVNNIISQDY